MAQYACQYLEGGQKGGQSYALCGNRISSTVRHFSFLHDGCLRAFQLSLLGELKGRRPEGSREMGPR